MSKLARSCIEILPDELWFEVFVYTSSNDLYFAWRNLNSRINAIIRSIPIRIHITSKSNDHIHIKNMLRNFPLQILHVKDERVGTTSSLLSESVDLLSLVNIRSLYLAKCSQEQLKQLINLGQLTRLSLPCNCCSATFLKQFVFDKKEEGLSQLQSIGRILCDDNIREKSSFSTVNTTIRHIYLVVPSCSSTVNFIDYLPELNSITVDYLGNEQNFPTSCLIWAKIHRQRSNGLDNRCSTTDSSSQPIDQKSFLFNTFAPCVYSLKIDFNGHCDFVKLARILQRCKVLQWLQITIKYYSERLDLASTRQLSPFFASLTFGNIHKETGQPMLVATWSS
jgi:hypothetical protein